MATVESVPPWLGTAIVGGVLAALGYVAQLGVEQYRTIQTARSAKLASLAELASLLSAGRVSFDIQNQHAQNLVKMLTARIGARNLSSEGYEADMTKAFPGFTPAERELHSVIRGITMHAMHPINSDMLAWLKKDTTFKGNSKRQGNDAEFAAKLIQLEAHLILWRAKYEVWIPNHPEHALVYLADEKEHGLGFPEGLDKLVESVRAGL